MEDSKPESVSLLLVFLCTIAIFPAICYGGDGYISSRATFYGSPDCKGTPTGACGFGEYGRTVNDGAVTGVSRLYKGGAGCGACYQVKCSIPALCSDEGTKVVVTDYGEGDRTDFVLSAGAYARLARPSLAEKLYAFGVVDVAYKRIPCRYNSNLVLKVHESSKSPGYLAIVPLYQPGAYEITTVQMWLEYRKEWRTMRRAYGAVFDMENPPMGAVTLRFQSSVYGYGNSLSWVQLKNVIPSDWKAGVSYDTGIST